MRCANTNVIDPAVFLIGKESVFDTFECFRLGSNDEDKNLKRNKNQFDRFASLQNENLRMKINGNKRRFEFWNMMNIEQS